MSPSINPFYATSLFRYLLKISENFWFPDIFKGYRKRLVAWNGLTRNRGIEEAVKNLWVATLYCWGEVEQTMRKVTQTIRNSSIQHIELGKSRCNGDFEDLIIFLRCFEQFNPFEKNNSFLRSLTSQLAANGYATKQNYLEKNC